ncbi:uncharacterized protein LOC120572737 isoform X9 [Perca fluviatilis]|uniref:uncharacterized protein LOC120572737 isoform X9 n=1 Tax=Perca fluviatilis TaxID=8168 RepID=UPI00196544DA|nr:uncharacterized protein LOC120572737 isoform X9 [Perca fluviatilis]
MNCGFFLSLLAALCPPHFWATAAEVPAINSTNALTTTVPEKNIVFFHHSPKVAAVRSLTFEYPTVIWTTFPVLNAFNADSESNTVEIPTLPPEV